MNASPLKLLCFLILTTSFYSLFGFQTVADSNKVEIIIEGRLVDAASNKAVNGANVYLKNSQQGTSSLANGKFFLKLRIHPDSFPLTIVVSHIAYEEFTSSIPKGFNRKLNLQLFPNIQKMKMVEVYSGPRQVASPYFSQIIDYELLGDRIVLLEKVDNSRKNRVRLVDFYGNLLGETEVKGKAISLFKDCRKEVYIIMQDRYLKVVYDIELAVVRSSQNFENRIKNPCRVLTDSFLIYEEYGYAKLMSWLLKREFDARSSSLFYFSANKTSIRLIQEDLLALRQKYGNIIQDLMYVEASLENTEESRVRDLVMEEDLSEQSLFYEPNFCPVFKHNNQLLVFDHGGNQLAWLNYKGVVQKTTKITYQKKIAWQPEIYQDTKRNAFYTPFKRGSWITLYQVNLNTGGISSFHKIENVFPEKIKVHNGYLLYLYRKPRTPDRYSLYLEKI